MSKLRLVVVDDHKLVRAGIIQLLAGQQDMEIIGQGSNGREAVELCKKLRPDVILLDITLPELDGIAALKQIKQNSPHTRIIMLTMHQDQAYLQQVLKFGANGYLLKTAGEADLINAIKRVNLGETVIDPQLAGNLLKSLYSQGSEELKTQPSMLSPREQEVLRLVALGSTDQEVADALHVSVKTVESYKAKIKEKLGLRRLAEMVRYAVEQGLV